MDTESRWGVGVGVTDELNYLFCHSGWSGDFRLIAGGGSDAYPARNQLNWRSHCFVHLNEGTFELGLEIRVGSFELSLSNVSSSNQGLEVKGSN